MIGLCHGGQYRLQRWDSPDKRNGTQQLPLGTYHHLNTPHDQRRHTLEKGKNKKKEKKENNHFYILLFSYVYMHPTSLPSARVVHAVVLFNWKLTRLRLLGWGVGVCV